MYCADCSTWKKYVPPFRPSPMGINQQRVLTNRQYGFTRSWNGCTVAVTVNNDDNEADFRVPVDSSETYIGTLTGVKVQPENGQIHVSVKGNFGEIWVPESALNEEPVTVPAETAMPEEKIVKDTVEQAKKILQAMLLRRRPLLQSL